MANPLLVGKNVSKSFGGLNAVREVDFEIGEKEIVGLIGPNGSGKTTLFNCVSGIYKPDSGLMEFDGRNIIGLRPYQICWLGVGRTFQLMQLFMNLNVLENAMVGATFGPGKSVTRTEAEELANRWLDFVGLSDKKGVKVKNLTLAQRKKLEIARALCTKPKLVLLDEVGAGLNQTETLEAMNMTRRIRDESNITVFWIEHVMAAIMNVAEKIIVLHHGSKIAEGTSQEIARDKKVVDAYLGEEYA